MSQDKNLSTDPDQSEFTPDGDPRCGCVCVVEDHCSHMGRCEEPVEGCGGSTVYCKSCYLNARANAG